MPRVHGHAYRFKIFQNSMSDRHILLDSEDILFSKVFLKLRITNNCAPTIYYINTVLVAKLELSIGLNYYA